jgi:alanine racemase
MISLVWVELDRSAAESNLAELRSCSPADRLFCAVVKSNAYGHGVREMIDLLQGADWFAVNSLDEGLELRGLGVSKPVLLLGPVPLERLPEAVEAELRLTLYNQESLDGLSQLPPTGRKAIVHLKVETGTWRQGIVPERAVEFALKASSIPNVELEGVSTHFANIEDTLNHQYAQRQLSEFRRTLSLLGEAGVDPPLKHTACTAASILFPDTHFSMLRAGIGVYGLWPSRETYLSALTSGGPVPDLRPVLTWKTMIAQIKDVPEGSYVGYGCTHRTTRPTRIGVLPVGYADGYRRALGNTAHVLVAGRRAPVLGRVCMNLVMVDITDVPDAGLENEVVLLGRSGSEEVTAEMLAEWAGTINYEVVTGISPFLPRRVTGGGRLEASGE